MRHTSPCAPSRTGTPGREQRGMLKRVQRSIQGHPKRVTGIVPINWHWAPGPLASPRRASYCDMQRQIENTRAVEDCSVGIRRSASSAPLPRALPRTARSRLSSIINSTYSHTTNLCHHHRFPTLSPTSIDPKDVTGWIHRVNEGSLMWAVGASSATNLR